MSAQPRPQRADRHRKLPCAAPETLGRSFPAAGHGQSRGSALLRARTREAIVIFGDYDVDGVTSTTLLLEVLGRLGWNVNAYLPNRLDEGYGLSRDGVENCLKKFSRSLLLAVDCGSTAVETIDWLRRIAAWK